MDVVSFQKVIKGNRVTLAKPIANALGGINEGEYISFMRNDSGEIVIKKVVA